VQEKLSHVAFALHVPSQLHPAVSQGDDVPKSVHAWQQVLTSHEDAVPEQSTPPPLLFGVAPVQEKLLHVAFASQQVAALHVSAFPEHSASGMDTVSAEH
jgi:hypothetical protein